MDDVSLVTYVSGRIQNTVTTNILLGESSKLMSPSPRQGWCQYILVFGVSSNDEIIWLRMQPYRHTHRERGTN